MNKYKFKDEMIIMDKVGPRGVVALYQDGKILFRKENMITNIGRTYVFYHFLKSFLGDNVSSDKLISSVQGFNELKLDSFALGSGGSMTTPDTTKLDSQIIGFGKGGFIPIVSEDGSESGELSYSGKELSINHTITDINTSYTIQELGLFLGNGKWESEDLNNKQLFSRVTFDPIPINPGSNYELEYTIYF